MAFIKINNSTLYYEIYGSGQPLLLIGGLMADHSVWDAIIGEFTQKYQVIVVDNHGVGQTVITDDFSIDAIAKDFVTLCEELNLKKPYVVGHSMGGAIAQTMVKLAPSYFKGMVLCNSSSKFNEFGRILWSRVLELHQNNVDPLIILDTFLPWAFSPSSLNVETINAMHQWILENPHPQSAINYERQFNALYDFNSTNWLEQITTPTLVLASEEDKLTYPDESKYLADNISGAKLMMLPNGHHSLVEAKEQLINAINTFCA